MDQGAVTLRRRWFARLAAAAAFAFAGHSVCANDPDPIPLDPGTDAAAYCSRVQAAFTREDFGVLEATAERARSLTTHFRGGKAELQVFYESFARVGCNQTYLFLTEDSGRARTTLAEHWLAEKPDSMTAKIASAMIWSEFAWSGRGRGYGITLRIDRPHELSRALMRAPPSALPGSWDHPISTARRA
jgi:hypothetical protein